MKRIVLAGVVCLVLCAGLCLSGCSSDDEAVPKPPASKISSESFSADYPYTVKRGSECHEVIQNPHKWALVQLDNTCGPGVAEAGLMEGHLDIDQDGTPELFLRWAIPSRGHEYLVFTPVDTGYRYVCNFYAGHFRSLSPDKKGRPRILVYEASGGHYAYINTYEHDGRKFDLTHTEGFTCGDGAPEENNRRLEQFKGQIEFVKSPATAFTEPTTPAH